MHAYIRTHIRYIHTYIHVCSLHIYTYAYMRNVAGRVTDGAGYDRWSPALIDEDVNDDHLSIGYS